MGSLLAIAALPEPSNTIYVSNLCAYLIHTSSQAKLAPNQFLLRPFCHTNAILTPFPPPNNGTGIEDNSLSTHQNTVLRWASVFFGGMFGPWANIGGQDGMFNPGKGEKVCRFLSCGANPRSQNTDPVYDPVLRECCGLFWWFPVATAKKKAGFQMNKYIKFPPIGSGSVIGLSVDANVFFSHGEKTTFHLHRACRPPIVVAVHHSTL